MNEEMISEEFISEMSKDFEVKKRTVSKIINDFKKKGIEEEVFLRVLTEYALFEKKYQRFFSLCECRTTYY